MVIGGNRQSVSPFVGHLSLLLGVICAISASVAAQRSAPTDFIRAGKAARRALVLVRARIPANARQNGDSWVSNTGIIVSEKGHVLTSLFAVGGAERVQVRSLSGQTVEASPLSLHQPSGLALLKTGLETPPLEMTSSGPRVGRWTVLAATRSTPGGNAALSLQPVVLSSVSASVRCHGLVHRDLVTFEAPCSSGSACAPLLDTGGRAVGILLNTMRTPAGLPCAYALPVRKLQPIVSDLLEGESTRSGWLGLAVMHTPAKEGLEIQAVLAGSPGHKSGLRPGDTLLAINGRSITSAEVFSSRVVKAAPGSEVKLRLLREDQFRTVRATVGRRPVIISRQMARGKACAGGGPADLTGPDAARQLRELRQANQQLRRMIEGLSREVQALKKKHKARRGGR